MCQPGKNEEASTKMGKRFVTRSFEAQNSVCKWARHEIFIRVRVAWQAKYLARMRVIIVPLGF